MTTYTELNTDNALATLAEKFPHFGKILATEILTGEQKFAATFYAHLLRECADKLESLRYDSDDFSRHISRS